MTATPPAPSVPAPILDAQGWVLLGVVESLHEHLARLEDRMAADTASLTAALAANTAAAQQLAADVETLLQRLAQTPPDLSAQMSHVQTSTSTLTALDAQVQAALANQPPASTPQPAGAGAP